MYAPERFMMTNQKYIPSDFNATLMTFIVYYIEEFKLGGSFCTLQNRILYTRDFNVTNVGELNKIIDIK